MLRFDLENETRRSATTASGCGSARPWASTRWPKTSAKSSQEQEHQIDLATALGEDVPRRVEGKKHAARARPGAPSASRVSDGLGPDGVRLLRHQTGPADALSPRCTPSIAVVSPASLRDDGFHQVPRRAGAHSPA